jgi:hypothetical protein
MWPYTGYRLMLVFSLQKILPITCMYFYLQYMSKGWDGSVLPVPACTLIQGEKNEYSIFY